MSVAIQGFLLGFAIALPVGPIGALCIQRSLAGGWRLGLATGLGAALADASYGALGVLGLTLLTAWLLDYGQWLRWGGGVFLFYLGLRTLCSRPVGAREDDRVRDLVFATGSTFLLTLANPATILSFAAAYAGLVSLEETRGWANAMIFILAVFTGSSFWWVILSQCVSRWRNRLSMRGLIWVNRVAGGLLIGFAGFAVLSAVLS